VWLSLGACGDEGEEKSIPEPIVVWDRKKEGGFPELKVLVGLLRLVALIEPSVVPPFLYRNNGFVITSNRAKRWDILTGNE
jgi:hypothetical protein